MREKEVLYSLTIIYSKFEVDQGIFDTLNDDSDNNFIVFMFAECEAQLMSFAFGVFLLSKQFITIHCRSPPSISL